MIWKIIIFAQILVNNIYLLSILYSILRVQIWLCILQDSW